MLILIAILVVLALWAVGIFNGLVTARNAFKNAFAQIDVQLQRRFDLIPNLVETAKGYIRHERERWKQWSRRAARRWLAWPQPRPARATRPRWRNWPTRRACSTVRWAG